MPQHIANNRVGGRRVSLGAVPRHGSGTSRSYWGKASGLVRETFGRRPAGGPESRDADDRVHRECGVPCCAVQVAPRGERRGVGAGEGDRRAGAGVLRLDVRHPLENGGVIACDDLFGMEEGTCTARGTAYPVCAACIALGCIQCCVWCVAIDGSCRPVGACAETDGLSCTACRTATIRKSTTECVDAATDDCMIYADGVSLKCSSGMARREVGVCSSGPSCPVFGDGICLRCANGLFADETGCCQCLRRAHLTFSV